MAIKLKDMVPPMNEKTVAELREELRKAEYKEAELRREQLKKSIAAKFRHEYYWATNLDPGRLHTEEPNVVYRFIRIYDVKVGSYGEAHYHFLAVDLVHMNCPASDWYWYTSQPQISFSRGSNQIIYENSDPDELLNQHRESSKEEFEAALKLLQTVTFDNLKFFSGECLLPDVEVPERRITVDRL